uniref:Secreted protein n=1 Tax=Oncorhynchus mykiss TaxID=8022 RepID=A0A8L0DUE3_ONCMY
MLRPLCSLLLDLCNVILGVKDQGYCCEEKTGEERFKDRDRERPTKRGGGRQTKTGEDSERFKDRDRERPTKRGGGRQTKTGEDMYCSRAPQQIYHLVGSGYLPPQ